LSAFIVPKGKTLLKGLNSYYVMIPKLIEHYKNISISGALYFKAYQAEGIVYFDEDQILTGEYRDKHLELGGKKAVDKIVKAGDSHNFFIDVIEIDPDKIYFWSQFSTSELMYKDLSAEFTDLTALTNKMRAEKLNGYIEVAVGKTGKEAALYMIQNGSIIGEYYYLKEGDRPGEEARKLLTAKLAKEGGIFNVRRIVVGKKTEEAETEQEVQEAEPEVSDKALEMVEELLNAVDAVVSDDDRLDENLETLLRRKFLEKADKYVFLDPFADEFRYSGGKATFMGEAAEAEFIRGVLESVGELVEENDLLEALKKRLGDWGDRYQNEVAKSGVKFW